MNWNPTQLPNSDIAARLARTSEPERRMPSRTSGAACAARGRRRRPGCSGRSRERAERARRGPAGVRRLDERVDEQQHRRRHRDGAGDVEARGRRAGGSLARHEPDRRRAARRARPAPAGRTPSASRSRSAGRRRRARARSRSRRSPCRPRAPCCAPGPSANVVVMIERPAGAVNAALTPLMKRVAISSVRRARTRRAAEATTKTPSEIRNTRRRPSRSAARPPSSRKPP